MKLGIVGLMGLMCMVQTGWACSPNWNDTLDVQMLADTPSPQLPAPRFTVVHAYRYDGGGCDSCGVTQEAEFALVAEGGGSAPGVQFEFPNGIPAEMNSFNGGDNDLSPIFEARGEHRSLRISWPVSGRVQVRARLVSESGEVGPWSDLIGVKQEEASCSSGIGWPLALLALLWRPRRRRLLIS